MKAERLAVERGRLRPDRLTARVASRAVNRHRLAQVSRVCARDHLLDGLDARKDLPGGGNLALLAVSAFGRRDSADLQAGALGEPHRAGQMKALGDDDRTVDLEDLLGAD